MLNNVIAWLVINSMKSESISCYYAYAKTLTQQDLIHKTDIALGLHVLSYNLVLDTSLNMKTSPRLQQTVAEQCFRFINSEVYFIKKDVSALHFNSLESRQTFFNEIRSYVDVEYKKIGKKLW